MKQNDTIDIESKRCWGENNKSYRAKPWRMNGRSSQQNKRENLKISHRRARAIDKRSLQKELKQDE